MYAGKLKQPKIVHVNTKPYVSTQYPNISYTITRNLTLEECCYYEATYLLSPLELSKLIQETFNNQRYSEKYNDPIFLTQRNSINYEKNRALKTGTCT